MPLMRKPGYQRIVPDHAVDAYLADGWQTDDVPEPPNKSDVKSVWVDYAESLGVDTDGMTKDDIIAEVEKRG